MSPRPPAGPSRLAIGYVRVSTEEQAQGPRAQRDALDRYARAHGLELVEVYDDVGVSGAAPIDERPGLLAALDALEQRRAEIFLVAKRDRIARDVMVSAMLDRLVSRAGARIESADGAANGDGPEAEMMRGILAVFAQFERALIRTRTKAALAAKKKRRERTGSIPYGFKLGDDAVRLEDAPDEQRCIGLAAELRLAGLSFASIGERLTAAGFDPREGGEWHPQTVSRLIRHARERDASA